jgi:glycosyltransferase involved in cell wall biosynthesis
MRLLFLCNHVSNKLGSFEHFIAALGRACGAGGNALGVALAEPPAGEVARCWDEAGVGRYVVKGWSELDGVTRPWTVVPRAMPVLREFGPDVVGVHFGNELPTAVLIAASRLMPGSRAQWVWHQRQRIEPPAGPVQRRLSRIRVLSPFCSRFVALYEGGRESLLLRGVPRRKVAVVYNGVAPFERTRAPGWLRAELDLPGEGVVIANVSSLIARKRLELSLDVLAGVLRAPDVQPPAYLLLVGGGPEEPALRAAAERLGVAANVRFLGLRHDVREILAESDLMLLTSEAEACPLAVIESMSVGIPCVATAAGAVPELIEDGVSGYVAPLDDVACCTRRVLELVRDESLRRRCGEAAGARWSRSHTLENMVAAHMALYRELVGG